LSRKNIGIIGSGIAGLSAAVHLQSSGHTVHVFEANSYPGGKLTDFNQDGFRFDAGPSLFTMPHLLDSVFEAAGKNPRDYYKYIPINPACNYLWPDGTRFEAPSDPEDFSRKAAANFKVPEKKLKRYFNKSGELYDITEDVFLKSSLHRAGTYLKGSTLKSFLQLYKANLFSSMNAVNSTALDNPKLVQLFNRYATYNGSDPFRAPGTLTVIPTLEHRWGTWLPEGGMHTITQSLFKLARDIGITFSFNEKVKEIIHDQRGVEGLKTDRGDYQFEKVVSNMDVVPTYRHLLPKVRIPAKVAKQERSTSALIFYWGIEGVFPDLSLHNILWSEDYQNEFHCLFEGKTICDDPTVYINITSKYEQSDAPAGHENWFVMVNAPYLAGQNWEELKKKTRENILKKLNKMLGVDIENRIKTERVLDPQLLQSQTSSHLGSLYGTSSNSKMAAFLRHPNFSSKVKNLYFCGGSVHPGGGIPLCLLSGKIVSDLAG
jgi:phytoene desaturase